MWLSDGLIRHVQWWRGLDALTVLHGVILAAVYTGTLLWAANYYRTTSEPSERCRARIKSAGARRGRRPSSELDLIRVSPTRRFFSSLLRGSSSQAGQEEAAAGEARETKAAATYPGPRTASSSSTPSATAAPSSSSPALPKHIAVIMDGNRRFGRSKFDDPLKGHWEGGKTLSEFIRWSMERGIDMLTVYAFSTENWSRDPIEVSTLMTIFCKYADSMRKEAVERGVRVRVLSSDPDRLPSHVRAAIRDLEDATRHGTSFHLNLCVSYGARGEITNACRRIAELVQEGKLSASSISESTISSHLLTANLPDPDLLIRTSGECRISNFLLFQVAYSELVFLDKTWPEVTAQDLDEILDDYKHRHRRFGK